MAISKRLLREGPYADYFSQAVQVGESIYLSGQVGIDETGNVPADLLSQMKLAYTNIEAVLKEYGASMDNIVDETWFVTDMKDCMAQVPALFSAREEHYGKKPEVCQTLVQVAALVDPSMMIEIKCVAVSG
ncbi:MAG: Rid family hydrolase [Halioglobus sp.]